MIKHSLNLEITHFIFELLWLLRCSSFLPVTLKYGHCCYCVRSYQMCQSHLLHLSLSVPYYLKIALLLLEFLFSRLNYLCSLKVFIKWSQVFSPFWGPFLNLLFAFWEHLNFVKSSLQYSCQGSPMNFIKR